MAHVSQTSPCLCLHILINDVGFGFDARGVEKTTTRPTSDLQPLNLWSNNAYAKAHSEQYLHAEEEEEPAVASQTCCLLSRHSSLCFCACACLHLLICVTGESEQLWTQGLAYLFFFFLPRALKSVTKQHSPGSYQCTGRPRVYLYHCLLIRPSEPLEKQSFRTEY